MSEAPRAPDARVRARERSSRDGPCYAALDLGTNNCRLLIATPSNSGFRVVEAYSRIVRLGEGLTQTGRLSEAAMERALAALSVSAEKVKRRKVVKLRAVATQACRSAENGEAFIERVAQETGMDAQAVAGDDGIVLRLPQGDKEPDGSLFQFDADEIADICLLYTSPSPRDS